MKTASMTTPLISITLPTFFVPFRYQPWDSWRGLTGARHASRAGACRARASLAERPRASSRCPRAAGGARARRHPGGVVEASAVRGDRRGEKPSWRQRSRRGPPIRYVSMRRPRWRPTPLLRAAAASFGARDERVALASRGRTGSRRRQAARDSPARDEELAELSDGQPVIASTAAVAAPACRRARRPARSCGAAAATTGRGSGSSSAARMRR